MNEPAPPARASPWRRLAAYAIDYALIVAYLAALTLTMWSVSAAAGVSLDDLPSPVARQGVLFLLLTLPVVLYFAIAQSSPAGATLGKRLLSLRVVSATGARATFTQTLLRAAVKFAPWELAHTAIWRISTVPEGDEAPLWTTLVFWFALFASAAYLAGLFTRSGRTLYDRIAATQVIHPQSAGDVGARTSAPESDTAAR